jgi:hypothetical protein
LKGKINLSIASFISSSNELRELRLKFNTIDFEYQVNRISVCGTYKVDNSVPINPVNSRTGRIGRWNLNYWGPNQSIKPIFTKYILNF